MLPSAKMSVVVMGLTYVKDVTKYGNQHQTVKDIQKTINRVKALLAHEGVQDDDDMMSALNELGMRATACARCVCVACSPINM